MPSDSVAAFLDQAQASRILHADQLEQIARRPELSRLGLPELCDHLERHRVLTPFQAEMVRRGRGDDLQFAGYPVQAEIGPCPGGTAYRALHPSLRTPVVLRRLRAEWLAPADGVAAFVQRARAASTLSHPHLVPLLDAGVYRDEPYAVLEAAADESGLDVLVADIGPMPGVLAVDFVRQAAAGLGPAHERGGFHGDVRPANLLVGALADSNKVGPDGRARKRPTPASAVRLAELGLVPIRPAAALLAPDAAALPYLPPERIGAAAYGIPGDMYGLGTVLFYLLTARAPYPGTSPEEVLHRIRTADAPPLESLRPDLPPALVAVVKQLLAKNSGERPASVAELEVRLAPFGRPNTPPPAAGAPLPTAVAVTVPSAVFPGGPVAEVPGHAPDASHPGSFPGAEEWAPAAGGSFAGGSAAGGFSTSALAATDRRVRTVSAADKRKSRVWLVVGIMLHSTAVCMLVGALYAFGVIGGGPKATEPDPTVPQKKKETAKEKAKKKKDKEKAALDQGE